MAEHDDNLRAADSDRERVAARLRQATDEGRLTLQEYDDRLRAAYQAKTYGELSVLVADLPTTALVHQSQVVPSRPAPVVTAAAARGAVPGWLRMVWGAWVVAVLVNVVIWALVSLSAGELIYFWPMWVAGPWGAILLATTLSGLASGAPQRWAEKREHGRSRRRGGEHP